MRCPPLRVNSPAIERIKQATTVRELKAAVNDLPHELLYDVDSFFFDTGLVLGYRASDRTLTLGDEDPSPDSLDDFDWDTVDDLKISRELLDECIDQIGADPDAGMLPIDLPAIMDTELCYRVVNAIPAHRPHASFATHDQDAGFRDLERPIAILRELGHEVVRDDALIARACG